MTILIQAGAALLITASLALLARYRGYTRGYLDGQRDGRAETQQLKYSEGYADGLYEGRLKAQMEQETQEFKQTRDLEAARQEGYDAAVQQLLNETYAAMRADQTTKSLSA